MNNDDKPTANPSLVLREEFDDWAVLFNPDADLGHNGFGLNPTGVYLWKLLDGKRSIDDLLKEIGFYAHDVPGEAREHLVAFIDDLAAQGLAGFGSTRSGLSAALQRVENGSSPPGHLCGLKARTYEPPILVNLSGARHVAYGQCANGGGDSGNCDNGPSAAGYCGGGCGANLGYDRCWPGACASMCYATGNSPFLANCLNGTSNTYECHTGGLALGYCNPGSGH